MRFRRRGIAWFHARECTISGSQGVIAMGLPLVVGVIFACVGSADSKGKGALPVTNREIEEPDVADTETSGNHRQAA